MLPHLQWLFKTDGTVALSLTISKLGLGNDDWLWLTWLDNGVFKKQYINSAGATLTLAGGPFAVSFALGPYAYLYISAADLDVTYTVTQIQSTE
jgi:hypothetical protein